MAGPHFTLFWAVLLLVGAYAGLVDACTARDPIGGMNSWGVNEGELTSERCLCYDGDGCQD